MASMLPYDWKLCMTGISICPETCIYCRFFWHFQLQVWEPMHGQGVYCIHPNLQAKAGWHVVTCSKLQYAGSSPWLKLDWIACFSSHRALKISFIYKECSGTCSFRVQQDLNLGSLPLTKLSSVHGAQICIACPICGNGTSAPNSNFNQWFGAGMTCQAIYTWAPWTEEQFLCPIPLSGSKFPFFFSSCSVFYWSPLSLGSQLLRSSIPTVLKA